MNELNSYYNNKYNKYIGARYVPIFDGEWDNTKKYEPLVIVSYQGASYTSKTFIPVGVEITNTQYWVLTGNYNAQVEYYRQLTEEVKNKVNNELQPSIEKNKNNLNSIMINVLYPPAPFEALKINGEDNKNYLENLMNAFSDVVFYFPNGEYVFSEFVIKNRNSILGDGYFTVIKKKIGSRNAVIQYDGVPTNWSRQCYLKNFRVVGLGTHNDSGTIYDVGDSSVHGILFNPYYGAENYTIENIFITDCGGTGFKIEPQNSENEKMVLQQSRIQSLHTRFCTNGMSINGFVGNVSMQDCTFERNVESAFKIGIGATGNGSQDLTFVNCAFQFSNIGVFFESGSLGTSFIGSHFENNTISHIKVNGSRTGIFNVLGCSFSFSPIDIDFNIFSDMALIQNCIYKHNNVGDTFIKMSSQTGIIFQIANKNIGTVNLDNPLIDSYLRIVGNNDFQRRFTLGEIRLLDGGISSTSARSRNLAGLANAISNQNYIDVVLPREEPDNNYRVVVTPWWNTTIWVTNKTTTGFKINLGTPVTQGGYAVEWHMLR